MNLAEKDHVPIVMLPAPKPTVHQKELCVPRVILIGRKFDINHSFNTNV